MLSPTVRTALLVTRRIAIVVAFVLVLLRPGFGETKLPTQLTDVDVLVVVDRTRSMAALDHEGREPRIDGAKEDLTELVKSLPGARLGMLAFGTDARLLLPLTTDSAAFTAAVETLYLEGPKDGVGSRADRPVAEVKEVLERAKEKHPERRRMVIYIGDGEDTTTEGQDQDFGDLDGLVDGGIVLGYGTTEGALMPESDDLDPGDGYVRDSQTGDEAVSRADLDNLKDIADELGVRFEHRTGGGGTDEIADSFEAAYSEGEGDRPGQHNLTWLFGLILFGLVLLELHAGWRTIWTSSQALLPAEPKGRGR